MGQALNDNLSNKIYMAAIPAATYQVSAVGFKALTDTNDGLRGVKSRRYHFNGFIGANGFTKSAAHEELYYNNLDTLTCFDNIGVVVIME